MLSALLPARAALIATCAVVLMLGALTEFGQFVVPDRGVSKLDLLANWSGALLGATLTWASSRVNLSLLFGVVRA
jgi:VanZ family protein